MSRRSTGCRLRPTHNLLADAGSYLLKNKPWDLYFMHVHTPDWMHHTIWSVGDIHGLFIRKDPGVKQGATIERTVFLADVTPTICHLAELPVPAQCEGSILYQALEDPDAQVKELQALRRNVERLKRMVERPPMC